LPAARSQLIADLGRAQQAIDSPTSSSLALETAGRFEQLASAALADQPPRVQHVVLNSLPTAAAATIRTSLAAAGALGHLGTTHRSLPAWRIVAPPPPATLLGYFRQAQARFGVPWEYLAAIEFIETKFGRVVGLSSAGAEGPMQFIPATWATYGVGDVHNPRDAILGAARYLVASGAPGDIAGALYHYNPSPEYVAAVDDYAAQMRADYRAYYGYYYWRVIYSKLSGAVILPVGYPRARPIPLRALLGSWSARTP
jgi:soluble lytic murein transglycosylase-like protein